MHKSIWEILFLQAIDSVSSNFLLFLIIKLYFTLFSMKKNYIFLDTNIIHNTLTHPLNALVHPNKDKYIWLHKLNSDFYNSGNMYILPQVLVELEEFNSDLINFSESNFVFAENFDIEILNDALDFYENFYTAILENIISLSSKKIDWYKAYITDSFLFLEQNNPEAYNLIPGIQQIKLHLENIDWIDFNQKDNAQNYSDAIANVVEGTILGDIKHRGFTYRDIFRSTGNFMFDYKNYQNKNGSQKQKVWKDAQVISELILWMDQIKSIPVNKNIIFITSDYRFIKEVKKFQTNWINGGLLGSEHYKWFSSAYIMQLNLVMQNLKVIKLNPETFLFENDLGSSHKIEDLI